VAYALHIILHAVICFLCCDKKRKKKGAFIGTNSLLELWKMWHWRKYETLGRARGIKGAVMQN